LTKVILFFFTFVLFFVTPRSVNSAEILQINSPDTILIGDQNRNLRVNLFCITVDDNNSLKATELLNSKNLTSENCLN